MKPYTDIVPSVLDLASVRVGGTVAESFSNSLTLAQCTKKWGCRRFGWRKLEEFLELTRANELILFSDFYRLEDRLRSYEIVAGLFLSNEIRHRFDFFEFDWRGI